MAVIFSSDKRVLEGFNGSEYFDLYDYKWKYYSFVGEIIVVYAFTRLLPEASFAPEFFSDPLPILVWGDEFTANNKKKNCDWAKNKLF